MRTTIFALSSGRGPSGVAVVRVSGPAAAAVIADLTGRSVPEPRRAVLRRLLDAAGDLIDEALVLFWRGPASFTGEDVAEFHVHGGRAVVARLLQVLGTHPSCRAAAAGDFTRQAFLNGRMDLTAVEGLGDLIAADTEAQRRAALGQLRGGLRRHCKTVAALLLRARAELEAAIDFADESDVPAEIAAAALRSVGAARAEVAALLAAGRPAERIRDGVVVVLAGAPNAGKSSLLNALAGRDVAIVSAEAGTTRDVLSVDLDLAGYPVRLMDTAGLREAAGTVEREGVRRARQHAAAADLVLLLHGADDPTLPPPLDTSAAIWTLRSKADLQTGSGSIIAAAGTEDKGAALAISTRTPGGLDALLQRLAAFAAETLPNADGDILLQERQRRLLESCGQCLDSALAAADRLELCAEEVRLAAEALGAITGAISTETVLGAIFAQFCIGK